MDKYHHIKNIKIENGLLVINVDGHQIKSSLEEISKTLSEANQEEQNTFEISPSGYGVHWPLLDEDIAIDDLLGVEHKPNQKKRTA